MEVSGNKVVYLNLPKGPVCHLIIGIKGLLSKETVGLCGGVKHKNLVSSTDLIRYNGYRKDIQNLTFQVLALHQE